MFMTNRTKGAVKFQYVTSESNPADLRTKPLAVPRHERLLQLTGLTPFESNEEESENDEWDRFRKKGVRFFGEEKGVRVIRSCKRKEGFFCCA